MQKKSDSAWVVDRAKTLGFDLCGVVRAAEFPELARTGEWLSRGFAGEMTYLSNPRRASPREAMPGVRAIIVCALNYNSPFPRSTDRFPDGSADPRGWISRYAWGQDYHEVLRKKLESLAGALPERFALPFDTRVYADTGPLNERVLARHAGLGWLGKNTLLLNQELGSWFFLGAILTTLDISPTLDAAESPPPNLCGSCTKCIDACPTGALVEPYLMDARLCISYLTIEFRGNIPEPLRVPLGHHVFGCDICQDVCPWNRRAPVTQAKEFQPRALRAVQGERAPFEAWPEEGESFFEPRLESLASLTQAEFSEVFRNSPIKRAKWRGLVRNACIALGNSALVPGAAAQRRLSRLLEKLSSSCEPIIAESARWALSRIKRGRAGGDDFGAA